MANVQAVWGIDMGRWAMKAIKLRPGAEGKVEVVAYDFIEHTKMLSQPDADRAQIIAETLEKFLSRNDVSKDRIAVGVPGQHTLARFSKLPPVTPKRIPDIVRYEADQQIPFDMDEVIWDYQTFQEEDIPDIEVGIFAMKRELVREHLLHFEQVAMEPIMVQTGPLAAYNAVHYEGLLVKETTIILDIGAESTDLVIATPSRLWTRTIPIGGNNFTEALVKSFKLSFSKAESLKRTAASSKYARQIFQAMRPVFADVVQELQRSIGFYSSTHRDASVEKIVAVGSAFLLPGLQKYLQQNLGMPVEIPQTFRKLTPAEGVSSTSLEEHAVSSFVAYGLALQGLGLTKAETNLLPAEIAKQVVWRKKRPAFAAAAVCLVLAGGLTWFRYTADMSALAANASGADQVRVSSVEEASRIINNGPSSNLSLRAQAKTVLEAGKSMKKAVQALSGQGDTERKQAQDILTTQRYKAIVPTIFQRVHDSLPQPQPGLAGLSDPNELAEAAKQIPREKRRQVFITMLNMNYVSDVDNPRWPDSLVQVEPPIHDFSASSIYPGFLVKIVCQTPNEGGAGFIHEEFMKRLKASSRRQGDGFYADRVYLIRGGSVGAAGTGPGAGRSGFGIRPQPGRGLTGSIGPDSLDPITNEPVANDWEFEIWMDVFMEDWADVAIKEKPADG